MNLCSPLPPIASFNQGPGHTSESLIPLKDGGQRGGLSAMVWLSFLLHCAAETLMPQVQILPYFGIAELKAYGLGR